MSGFDCLVGASGEAQFPSMPCRYRLPNPRDLGGGAVGAGVNAALADCAKAITVMIARMIDFTIGTPK
ncbi:MAG: hypothetical protein RLZZ511_2960 [Cyanobacteriota bacterium]|jgi:hypothetical protein